MARSTADIVHWLSSSMEERLQALYQSDYDFSPFIEKDIFKRWIRLLKFLREISIEFPFELNSIVIMKQREIWMAHFMEDKHLWTNWSDYENRSFYSVWDEQTRN